MYNRGDYIIFSMKARIADTIHDPVHGMCYVVECLNPTNSVIRIPIGNVDVKTVSQPRSMNARRPMPPAVRDENPPSPPVSFIDGQPQSPRPRISGEYWRRDSFSDLQPPRPDYRLRALGCHF